MPWVARSRDGVGHRDGVTNDESRKMEVNMCALQLWPTRNSLCGSHNLASGSPGPSQSMRNSRNCNISCA